MSIEKKMFHLIIKWNRWISNAKSIRPISVNAERIVSRICEIRKMFCRLNQWKRISFWYWSSIRLAIVDRTIDFELKNAWWILKNFIISLLSSTIAGNTIFNSIEKNSLWFLLKRRKFSRGKTSFREFSLVRW